jgi:hypothetical protein
VAAAGAALAGAGEVRTDLRVAGLPADLVVHRSAGRRS